MSQVGQVAVRLRECPICGRKPQVQTRFRGARSVVEMRCETAGARGEHRVEVEAQNFEAAAKLWNGEAVT